MYKEENEKMVVKSGESMEFCESVPVDFMVNLKRKKNTEKWSIYDQTLILSSFFPSILTILTKERIDGNRWHHVSQRRDNFRATRVSY